MGDLLPVTFLIDRTRKIQAVKEGFGKKEEFESTIEKLVINAQRLEKVKLGQAPGALQGTDLDS
jgi:hypothetical protein